MNCHTKESLLCDLKKAGINPNGTLFIHSSMKAVGACENGADTVLDALFEYMKSGLLVLPTHTWQTVNEKMNVFDPNSTPACVGILPNLMMKRSNVLRSLHPTHSVAAFGTSARDFIQGEEKTTTPCPRNGCYGKLYDRKAQILFLGCDLSKNTFLHGVEEWCGIKNRLAKKSQKLFIKINNMLIPCPQFRHDSSVGDVSANYIKMKDIFIKKGIASSCIIGDANSFLCDSVKMADLTCLYLKSCPDLFADDSPPRELKV